MQVVLLVPDRLPSAPESDERIEIRLRRCRLETCQRLLVGKDYCDERHKNAFHNQQRKLRG